MTPVTLINTDYALHHYRQNAVSAAYICYGLRQGHIRVLSRSSAVRALLKGHTKPLTDLQFAGGSGTAGGDAAGGSLLASGGQDGQLYVWQLRLDGDAAAVEDTQKLHASFVAGGGELGVGRPAGSGWGVLARGRQRPLPPPPPTSPLLPLPFPSPWHQALLATCSCRGTPPASACWLWAWAAGCCWWLCRRRAWSSWSLMWPRPQPRVRASSGACCRLKRTPVWGQPRRTLPVHRARRSPADCRPALACFPWQTPRCCRTGRARR